MTQQEHYNKTDEILAKFNKGEELYKTSALFNNVIQMLVRGMSEYEIIEFLVTSVEDNRKAFEQYIHRDIRPMIINR